MHCGSSKLGRKAHVFAVCDHLFGAHVKPLTGDSALALWVDDCEAAEIVSGHRVQGRLLRYQADRRCRQACFDLSIGDRMELRQGRQCYVLSFSEFAPVFTDGCSVGNCLAPASKSRLS
jgi:hypothetical protein